MDYKYQNKSLEFIANKYKKDLREYDVFIAEPMDIESLALALGLIVVPKNDIKKSGELNEDNEIIINANDHPFRQRFTIAHEIAHFVKGHGASDRDQDKEYTTDQLAHEIEANNFAAELLMPKYKVIEKFQEVKDLETQSIVEELAIFFCISRQSIQWRLHNIGLLKIR